MLGGPRKTSQHQSLQDWLQLHANIHIQTYSLITGLTAAAPPDLSVVDFSVPAQFYDWMYAHQVMTDLEQSVLGLT